MTPSPLEKISLRLRDHKWPAHCGRTLFVDNLATFLYFIEKTFFVSNKKLGFLYFFLTCWFSLIALLGLMNLHLDNFVLIPNRSVHRHMLRTLFSNILVCTNFNLFRLFKNS